MSPYVDWLTFWCICYIFFESKQTKNTENINLKIGCVFVVLSNFMATYRTLVPCQNLGV